MIKPWKKLEEKTAYDCGFFKILTQQSASPTTGKTHPFYVLSTRSWTNVVAITEDNKVVLVSQFRHGTREISLEIPGGALDPGDKMPEQAARRELLEETGHEAPEWHLLGVVRPNPAILDNTCHFFLALGAKQTSALKLDEAEELEVRKVDLKEIPEMIRDGRIQHALVVAAFHYLDLYRQENPGKFK